MMDALFHRILGPRCEISVTEIISNAINGVDT